MDSYLDLFKHEDIRNRAVPRIESFVKKILADGGTVVVIREGEPSLAINLHGISIEVGRWIRSINKETEIKMVEVWGPSLTYAIQEIDSWFRLDELYQDVASQSPEALGELDSIEMMLDEDEETDGLEENFNRFYDEFYLDSILDELIDEDDFRDF